MDSDKEKLIADEYMSSLTDLNVNSKPLINMLTMLADDNMEYASVIVKAIEQHLLKVPPEVKLPVLYLIDSIVKNVGNQYKVLFSHNIVNLFCSVFEKVNEKVREKMFNLRQTWNEVFPNTKLYALDVKVNVMDPNWPITAKVVPSNAPSTIHVNPNFFKQKAGNATVNDEIQKQLKDKERELLELQKRKLELELLATKKKLEESVSYYPGDKTKPTDKTSTVPVQKVEPSIAATTTNSVIPPMLAPQSTSTAKPRINPVTNVAMLAKSRDPRLARHQHQQQQQQTQAITQPMNPQVLPQVVPNVQAMQNGAMTALRGPYGLYPNQSITKMLPKIPKYSNTNSKPSNAIVGENDLSRRDKDRERERDRDRDRDPRRNRDDKSKSSSSSRGEKSNRSSEKSSRSSDKTTERKKSGSSDESKSPRKRKEDVSPRKSSKSSSSSKSHRSSKSPERKSSSKSITDLLHLPSTSAVNNSVMKDVDLRMFPQMITAGLPTSGSPDSSSEEVKKSNKQENDTLLKKLLHEDDAGINNLIGRSSPIGKISPVASPRDALNDFIPEHANNEATKQDTDLRRFIDERASLNGNSKRSLGDNLDVEPTMKKTRPDKFDPLFGNQDVDLRKIPAAVSGARPSPPPPPLIRAGEKDTSGKQQLKSDESKSSFEAVRAKLAKATEKKNRADESQKDLQRKRKLSDTLSKKISSLDTDIRNEFKMDLEMDESSYKDAFNDKVKTIYQQVKDQLEEGKIDKEQYNDTVKQLYVMNEMQKIKDVKRQESFTTKSRDPRLQQHEDSDSENSNGNSNQSFPKRSRYGHDDKQRPLSDPRLEASAFHRDRRNRDSKWGPASNAIPPMPIAPIMPIPPIAPGIVSPWEQNPFMLQQMQMLQQQQQQSQASIQAKVVKPGKKDEITINNHHRNVRLDGTNEYLLRFYDDIAMAFDQATGRPNDIKFSPGYCTVNIDDQYKIALKFNDSYKPITIDGKLHQIKFGTPTRELYIDDCFYECYFNNHPTQILLDGKLRTVKIDCKSPEVILGKARPDVVFGRINIVIDAELIIPVFLDTTVQLFEVKNQVHSLQFADFFKSVLINGEPYKVEFGGMPKNFNLKGQKHFIRFTALPDNVEPGQVNLPGFVRTRLYRDLASPPLIPFTPAEENLSIPVTDVTSTVMQSEVTTTAAHPAAVPALPALQNLNIDELFQKLVATGIINHGQSAAPEKKPVAKEVEKKKIAPVSFAKPETIKIRQQGIVDSIYSGMQCSSCGLRFPPEQTMKYSQHLDWHFRQNRRDRDSQRRAHSRKWYYDTADWIRYEEIEDLEEREKNFFETQQIEAMDQIGDDSNHARTVGGSDSQAVPSCPAGPDDLNRRCDMCHDQFEQFYNEETEEWHLRLALKVDDKFYHPLCYEDFKASLTLDESAMSATLKENSECEENEEHDEKSEVGEVKVKVEESAEEETSTRAADDEDDDVIVLPTEAPVVTEILDDEETVKDGGDEKMEDKSEETEKDVEKKDDEEEKESDPNITDDDVMIQEPNIETQNLVDDDDDDDEEHQSKEKTPEEPYIVKIKEEPKDDGYEDENEEDNFMEVSSIANNFIDDTFSNSPHPISSDRTEGPNAAELHEINDNAVMNSPSTIDDNSQLSAKVVDENADSNHHHHHQQQQQQEELYDVDESSHPEHPTGSTVGSTNKIKIVLSSLVANNLNSNRNLSNSNVNNSNNNNNLNEETNSNLESANKLDGNNVNIDTNNDSNNTGGVQEYEQPDIPYEVKPNLRGINFDRNLVPIKRGLENSGLCSIM